MDVRNNPIGLFITVYDIEVIENNEHFKGKKYNKILDEEKLRNLMRKAVSIILYGERAVSLGIKEGYIHPEAVSYQHDVKVAIYIETRRL